MSNFKDLVINISENDWGYLITTPIDDWIYAEWKTLEDALINFLDVLKIVRWLKWNNYFKESLTTKSFSTISYKLPIMV